MLNACHLLLWVQGVGVRPTNGPQCAGRRWEAASAGAEPEAGGSPLQPAPALQSWLPRVTPRRGCHSAPSGSPPPRFRGGELGQCPPQRCPSGLGPGAPVVSVPSRGSILGAPQAPLSPLGLLPSPANPTWPSLQLPPPSSREGSCGAGSFWNPGAGSRPPPHI